MIDVTKQAYSGLFVDIDAVGVLSVEYEGVADVSNSIIHGEDMCLDFIESGGAFYGRGVPLCISGVLNSLEEDVKWDEGVILSSN